jgi:transposase-like protein
MMTGKRPDRAGTQRTEEKRAAFLAVLAKGYSVTAAVEAAGLARSTVYAWRESDPAFAQAWEEAEESGTDRLEDVAYQRATDGVLEPVYQGGRLVGEVRKVSDTLAIFLLKGRRPWKFKDSFKAEVTGLEGPALTDQERGARIAALIAAGTARAKGEADGPDCD